MNCSFQNIKPWTIFQYCTEIQVSNDLLTLGNTVKLSLCLTVLRHEGVRGSGYIDPHLPNLGTRWRWVVSFTPRVLYPRGWSPRYPLGGPWNPSGRRGEEKILDPTGTLNSDTSVAQLVASRYTDYGIPA
jgi:hypothetical protein